MNAKTPDYGEPWNVGRIDRPTEDRHGHDPLMLHSTASRAVLCVNACAGMVDPAAELQKMREAIREAHDALNLTLMVLPPPFDWQRFQVANAVLAKLQFFTAQEP